MTNTIKKICAVSAAALMMLAGCSKEEEAAPDTASTIVASKAAGNSGDVTLASGDTYAVISIRDYGDITVKLYPEETPVAFRNFTELAKRGDYNGRNFHRIIEEFMAQGGSADSSGSGGASIDGGTFKPEINTSLRHYYGALCMASAGGNQSDQFYIVNNKVSQTELTATYEQYVSAISQQEQLQAMYLNMFDPNDADSKMYIDYYTTQKQFYHDYAIGAQAMLDTLTDEVNATYASKGGVPFLDGGYTVFGQTVDGFDVLDAITAVEKVDDGNGNISKPAEDIIIDKIEIFTK